MAERKHIVFFVCRNCGKSRIYTLKTLKEYNDLRCYHCKQKKLTSVLGRKW